MRSEKSERGLKRLQALDPKAEDSLAILERIVPGLAGTIVEYEVADICTRPGLDLKTRQLITVASLASRCYATHQLQVPIRYALKVAHEVCGPA
jgi:4-carboxymuconolactone decarboxylase